jgi:hypothetical protein
LWCLAEGVGGSRRNDWRTKRVCCRLLLLLLLLLLLSLLLLLLLRRLTERGIGRLII